MAEDQIPGVENSIFYNDVDNKYASQFEEFKSSTSHQTPGKYAPYGLTGSAQNKLTSPSLQ